MTFNEEYTKLALIGNGAFSTIWKVRHNQLGYVRAMKISKDDIESEDDTAYQTFLNECQLLLRIGNGGHPNIIRVYQPRFVENKAVVEMDYVEGETLCDYIKRVKFVKMDEIIQFFRQIVGALAYCHVDIYKFMMDIKEDHLEIDMKNARNIVISPEKEAELIEKYGVVHNDLHSNNIMRRSYDGQYILLDFGLAIQDGHSIKSSSRADGAVEYKAPEKWNEKTYELTARTDVYGLGVLLFEMLTGRPPFPYQPEKFPNKEAAIYSVYNAHLQEEPPFIMLLRKQAFEQVYPDKKYARDYPEWLEDMIRKCLAKDPADRYANAKEMLEEFEGQIKYESPQKFLMAEEITNDNKFQFVKVSQEMNPNETVLFSTKIEDRDSQQEFGHKNHKKKAIRIRMVIAAAVCIIIIICVGFLWGMKRNSCKVGNQKIAASSINEEFHHKDVSVISLQKGESLLSKLNTLPPSVTNLKIKGEAVLSVDDWEALRDYIKKECIKTLDLVEMINLKTIMYSALSKCNSLTSVTIPNSVHTIDNGAFYQCTNLNSITISNSLKSIGVGAFKGCSGLKSITIPNSVISIDGDAFSDCSSLTSITIPNGLTSIESGTFKNCI